ncbi:MAG TPA: hypothetical protein VFE32_04585 [Puia sp.]|jgi:hypothetical protein|nr:hypothetical protein [Puia sp.]
MFNNVALDVVIGLVLVFLLYGLLVTILTEMVASWLGFRQRMLRLCIERMLNDNYYDHGAGTSKKIWHAIKRFFLIEFGDFKFSVAGRFYAEPSIKYLAKGEKATKFSFTNSKPSYIDPDTFALTLIHMMRDKGRGDTDMDKIRYCLTYNTLHFQRETIRGIRAMFDDSSDNINFFADKLKSWFNESMQRNTGWYKRMMRIMSFVLGLGLALTFNIDSIRIAQLLSRDKEARGQLVNLAVGVAHDTLLANSYGNPDAPPDRRSAIVDSSLAHVSQDISLANFVLGLGWGLDRLGNKVADTVRVSASPATYHSLYDLRIGADSVESYRRGLRRTQSKFRAADRYFRLQQSLNLKPDSVKGKEVLRLTDSVDRYLLLLFDDSLRSYEAIVSRVDTLTGKDYFRVGPIQSIIQPTDSLIIINGLTPYSNWHKIRYWWHSVFGSGWLRLLGLLLTAIALSLGAPFWFDMLAKIVAIRGSGTSPAPPKPPTEVVITSGPVLINIPPAAGVLVAQPPQDALTVAVLNARTRCAGIPGVLSIDAGLSGRKGSMVDVIEIHAVDAKCATQVRTLFGSSYRNYGLNVLVTARAKAHLRSGDTIMNDVCNQQPPPVTNNGTGTLGCFVKKDGSTAQYLISCWHVLKGDWNWASHGGPDIITDGGGNNIATVVDGCLSTDMDIGFAQLNGSGNTNSFTKQWREVTKEDVNQHMTVQFRGSSSGSVNDPVIFNNSVSITGGLEYPDGVNRVLTDMFSITKLVDGTPTPPSDHGDSGSLVLDANNVPLGILVGADEMFTYVAKLSNILAKDGIYKEYQLSI